jgi:hypothetical protein
MFRTVFAIAAVGLCAWIAIQIIFGVAGGLVGLLLSLAWLALKVVLVVGLVYWLLSVFSPDTARKMRESMKGPQL